MNKKGQRIVAWPWFDEYLLCGKSAASGRGKRDGKLDGLAKLKPTHIATLLKKQQQYAGLTFKHKRHFARGASTRAQSDLGALEQDRLKAGRWKAKDAMTASYDYSLPNVRPAEHEPSTRLQTHHIG